MDDEMGPCCFWWCTCAPNEIFSHWLPVLLFFFRVDSSALFVTCSLAANDFYVPFHFSFLSGSSAGTRSFSFQWPAAPKKWQDRGQTFILCAVQKSRRRKSDSHPITSRQIVNFNLFLIILFFSLNQLSLYLLLRAKTARRKWPIF